jgi:WhiB family redox-sensing transcriptional regulator
MAELKGTMDLLAEVGIWDGALCQQSDPEVWFDPKTVDIAKEICDDCPLRIQCARYAIENEIEHGVWGGMSEQDRVQAIKTLKRNGKM